MSDDPNGPGDDPADDALDGGDPFADWHRGDEVPTSTAMTRLRDRAGRAMALLLSLLLVLPVGAWAIDAFVFRSRGGEVADAVPALADAVALVSVRGCDGSGGSGSGFALAVDGRSVVVTNRHVVEGADAVGLRTLDGTAGPLVEEVLLSRSGDVAVLVLDRPLGSDLALGPAPLPGDQVRLVGFPGARPVTSAGEVAQARGDRTLLSMEVDPGASGAPVVDAAGRVVAQVVARTTDGLGVAIPSTAVAAGLGTLVPAPDC